MDTINLSDHFNSVKPLLERFNHEMGALKVTPAQVAIGFLNGINEINRIICGVNNLQQFKELTDCKKLEVDMSWAYAFAIDDEQILNPANWK